MPRKSKLEKLKEEFPDLYQANETFNSVLNQTQKFIDNTASGIMRQIGQLLSQKTEFNLGGDYTHLNYNEREYFLSPMQASAIKYMAECHDKGQESVFDQDILDACKSKQTSLHKLFKNKEVMGEIIKKKRNNYYYLDID